MRDPVLFIYKVGQHREHNTGRYRWGVQDTKTNVWYFSRQYGKLAADKLANKLNKKSRKPRKQVTWQSPNFKQT